MNKPAQLKIGDKVAIVSLSHGALGEAKYAHMLNLGIKRLKEFGLVPVFMKNALKGKAFLNDHPEAKAQDLKDAFANNELKAVFTTIGGRSTFGTFEYLLNDEEFKENVKNHPKLFLGFSDTTGNHLMFHKLGLNTFYGPTFWTDFGDLDVEMSPYSRDEFLKLFINPNQREILSSPVWYDEPIDHSINGVGVPKVSHQETHGYEVLRGTGIVEGKLLGGCVESLYFGLTDSRSLESKLAWQKYEIFPEVNDWKDKIIFLETSDIRPTPEEFRLMLQTIGAQKIFEVGAAIMFGKPVNEQYYEEYKTVLLEVTKDSQIPIIYNLNFGHAHPRTTIPYNLNAKIDFDQKRVFITEPFFQN